MGPIKRVLNVEEIRKIWMACDVFRDCQTSYGSFIQMLFLTAQRRNEIALMQRDEIDLKKIVPHHPGLEKQKRPHS